MEQGEVTESATGRTKYVVVGFTESGNDIRMFVQGPQGFMALLRESSVTRRIKEKLFNE
jgi:hypothetical protein